MWEKIDSIENVFSGLKIAEDRIIYYSDDYKMHVLNRHNLSELMLLNFKRDFEYSLFGDIIYLSCDDKLIKYDLNKGIKIDSISSGLDYIVPILESVFFATSYKRGEKVYQNLILDIESQVINEIEGSLSYRDIYLDNVLMSDRQGSKIGLLDSHQGILLWESALCEVINGKSLDLDKKIIIPLSHSLIAISKNDGNLLWKQKLTLSYYSLTENRERIVGLFNDHFEIRCTEKGEIILEVKLLESLDIPSHLTFYKKGTLYFSGSINQNSPMFGAVDVNNGELKFLQEINLPGEKTFRKGLGRPYFDGNRLYVRDTMNTLHIFENIEEG